MLNKTVVTILILFIVIYIVVLERKSPEKVVKYSPSPTPYITNEDELFRLIQAWKLKKDDYTYIKDENLCSFADKRMQDMKTSWSHDGFHNKTNIIFSYGFINAGENLSRGVNEEKNILTEWLNSPKHKANLDKNYTHTCLKCRLFFPNKENVCVHIFASY